MENFIKKQLLKIKKNNTEIISRGKETSRDKNGKWIEKINYDRLRNQLVSIYELDKTSNKQYSSHIMKLAIEYNCLNFAETDVRRSRFGYFVKVIETYFTFITSFGLRNYGVKIIKINQFKTFEELVSWIKSSLLKVKETKNRRNVKNAKKVGDVIFEDEIFRITVAKHFSDLNEMFSGNTKWCVAKDERDFNSYITNGLIFVFEDKRTDKNDIYRFSMCYLKIKEKRQPYVHELQDINNKPPKNDMEIREYAEGLVGWFEETQGVNINNFSDIFSDKSKLDIYLSQISDVDGYTIIGDKIIFKDELSLYKRFVNYDKEVDAEMRKHKLFLYGGLSVRGYDNEVEIQEIGGNVSLVDCSNLRIVSGIIKDLSIEGSVELELEKVKKLSEITGRAFDSFDIILNEGLEIDIKLSQYGLSKLNTGEGRVRLSLGGDENILEIMDGQEVYFSGKRIDLKVIGNGLVEYDCENSDIEVDDSVELLDENFQEPKTMIDSNAPNNDFELITELREGNSLILYHRTKKDEYLSSIAKNGFTPGGGDYYGKGLYANYNMESVMGKRGSGWQEENYGKYIFKFKYQLEGKKILVLNEELRKSIYGENSEIDDMLNLLENKDDKRNLQKILNRYKTFLEKNYWKTSDIARDNFEFISKNFDAVCFNGGNDGDVCVIYDYEDIQPFAVAKTSHYEFQKNKYGRIWTVATLKELRNGKLQTYAKSKGIDFKIERDIVTVFGQDKIRDNKKAEEIIQHMIDDINESKNNNFKDINKWFGHMKSLNNDVKCYFINISIGHNDISTIKMFDFENGEYFYFEDMILKDKDRLTFDLSFVFGEDFDKRLYNSVYYFAKFKDKNTSYAESLSLTAKMSSGEFLFENNNINDLWEFIKEHKDIMPDEDWIITISGNEQLEKYNKLLSQNTNGLKIYKILFENINYKDIDVKKLSDLYFSYIEINNCHGLSFELCEESINVKISSSKNINFISNRNPSSVSVLDCENIFVSILGNKIEVDSDIYIKNTKLFKFEMQDFAKLKTPIVSNNSTLANKVSKKDIIYVKFTEKQKEYYIKKARNKTSFLNKFIKGKGLDINNISNELIEFVVDNPYLLNDDYIDKKLIIGNNDGYIDLDVSILKNKDDFRLLSAVLTKADSRMVNYFCLVIKKKTVDISDFLIFRIDNIKLVGCEYLKGLNENGISAEITSSKSINITEAYGGSVYGNYGYDKVLFKEDMENIKILTSGDSRVTYKFFGNIKNLIIDSPDNDYFSSNSPKSHDGLIDSLVVDVGRNLSSDIFMYDFLDKIKRIHINTKLVLRPIQLIRILRDIKSKNLSNLSYLKEFKITMGNGEVVNYEKGIGGFVLEENAKNDDKKNLSIVVSNDKIDDVYDYLGSKKDSIDNVENIYLHVQGDLESKRTNHINICDEHKNVTFVVRGVIFDKDAKFKTINILSSDSFSHITIRDERENHNGIVNYIKKANLTLLVNDSVLNTYNIFDNNNDFVLELEVENVKDKKSIKQFYNKYKQHILNCFVKFDKGVSEISNWDFIEEKKGFTIEIYPSNNFNLNNVKNVGLRFLSKGGNNESVITFNKCDELTILPLDWDVLSFIFNDSKDVNIYKYFADDNELFQIYDHESDKLFSGDDIKELKGFSASYDFINLDDIDNKNDTNFLGK